MEGNEGAVQNWHLTPSARSFTIRHIPEGYIKENGELEHEVPAEESPA